MIGDACERSDDADLTCQICIVGAGAAGIALAVALAGTSIDVIVLEAGGRAFDRRAQDLYRGEVVDERLHSPLHTYRARRFGGSTTIWGVPFDPIDFEERDWVPHSGWPITRADLEPFYARANVLCEAGAYTYTAPAAFRRPLREIVDGFRGIRWTAQPKIAGHRYRSTGRVPGGIRADVFGKMTDAVGFRGWGTSDGDG